MKYKKINPGSIVNIRGSKPHQKKSPWIYAEGLLLGYKEGRALVLWYKEPEMTLHWNCDNLKMKKIQDISQDISPDAIDLLNKLNRYLTDGRIGV